MVCGCGRFVKGFTLLEVLVSLALASVVMGAILSDMSRQVGYFSRMQPRYSAMLTASGALEKAMAERRTAAETDKFSGVEYHLTVASVPADPRIEAVKSEAGLGTGTKVTLIAYRLRSESAEGTSSSGQ